MLHKCEGMGAIKPSSTIEIASEDNANEKL